MIVRQEPILVIASRNVKKRLEIEQLLGNTACKVLTLADFPDCPEVEETGSTFMENAILKAVTSAVFTGHLTLADDSGLEVAALGGLPGIHSARFSSPNATVNAADADNIRYLLQRMKDIPEQERSARFVCAMALAEPTGQDTAIVVAETLGTVEGQILHETRGTHGFGYDPLFFVPDYGKTFGELDPRIKQQISHRSRALQQMLPKIHSRLFNQVR